MISDANAPGTPQVPTVIPKRICPRGLHLDLARAAVVPDVALAAVPAILELVPTKVPLLIVAAVARIHPHVTARTGGLHALVTPFDIEILRSGAGHEEDERDDQSPPSRAPPGFRMAQATAGGATRQV